VIIRWSERARTQVREIFEYIARDRPRVAERILESFLERVELLAEFPEQGSALGGRSDLRAIVHESHRIVYRVGLEDIAILSVRHTRRAAEDDPGNE
jgi:plasmid stabilization system protein ParE